MTFVLLFLCVVIAASELCKVGSGQFRVFDEISCPLYGDDTGLYDIVMSEKAEIQKKSVHFMGYSLYITNKSATDQYGRLTGIASAPLNATVCSLPAGL